MKLRTRLAIAFLVIVLIPVLMSGVALFGFNKLQTRSFQEAYGIENYDYEDLTNPTPFLSRLTSGIHEELSVYAQEDVSFFEQEEQLQYLNEELESRSSYLIIRQGDDITFTGNQEETAQMEDQLPVYGTDYGESENAVYIGGVIQSLVKKVDYISADGQECSAFIVTDMANLAPQLRTMYTSMLVAIIVILMLTGLGLMLWIYHGIKVPLNKLSLAAENIKNGNLDFHLETRDCRNEIEELCIDFEEMRKRLKVNAEEKLDHDRENKELISNISHDLKTPITAVKGYVEGIMDGVADTPEKMDKYIRTIYNKANEMDMLINELTFYSKIDTNKIPYTFNKISVNEYFSDCIEELTLEMEEKNVDFAYSNYVSEDVEIIADAEQIKRVIHNIVNNSVKYMDKSKALIHIRVNDVGDYIQVEIEDNGRGIAAKDLPFIFDRFYRSDSSRNSAQGGSGIGLSIVRKIIEEHGGKIWATSKENTGTVMYFVLRKYEEVLVDE